MWGNLLESGQLFLGEILWWGAAIFRVEIFLGRNYPGGNCPGTIIWEAITQGAIVRGAIFLGVSCPRTFQKYSLYFKGAFSNNEKTFCPDKCLSCYTVAKMLLRSGDF